MTLGKELQVGLRSLLQNRVYSLIAILTLAVGIGANTTIFSVVNAVLLEPLPYADSDRLVWIWETNHRNNILQEPASVPNFYDWKEQNAVFDDMAAFGRFRPVLTGKGEPARLSGGYATPNLFHLLGVEPALGRGFTEDEGQTGGDLVVILSHALWQSRFGGGREILGQAIELNGRSRTVVGVMPANYRHLDLDGASRAELWIPVVFDPSTSNRRSDFLSVVARMGPNVGVEQARADITTIASRLAEQYPDTNGGWTVTLIPLRDRFAGEIKTSLLVLLCAVAFLLLIGCANVASLQLTRASGRGREMAIRSALGAGRWRLVRQHLTESALLAFIGGGVGVLIAFWGIDALLALRPAELPLLNTIRIDGTVLSFTLLVSLVTGIAFGILPALQASQTNLNSSLREGGRTGGDGSGGRRTRNALVIAEVAVALLLLVGAGLTIRSLYQLLNTSPGVDPHGVLTAQIGLPRASYPDPTDVRAFYDRLLTEVRSIPGIESAAASSDTPLAGAGNFLSLTIDGRTMRPDEPEIDSIISDATPGYFRTMRIPLLKGRLLEISDDADAPAVAVINAAMERRFWPDGDALGARITTGPPEAGNWVEIVGVVGNVHDEALDVEPYQQTWLPHAQSGRSSMALMLRAAVTPESLAEPLRRAVSSIDPQLPVTGIRSMEGLVAESLAQRRFSMILLSIFAGMALLLATVGIYGVISYTVSQRTREIGIRMALGADHSSVQRMVVRHGLGLALSGVAIGLVAAFGLTRLMVGLVHGISVTDPLTFIAIAGLLATVSLVACWLPARRATRVDPLIALRYE